MSVFLMWMNKEKYFGKYSDIYFLRLVKHYSVFRVDLSWKYIFRASNRVKIPISIPIHSWKYPFLDVIPGKKDDVATIPCCSPAFEFSVSTIIIEQGQFLSAHNFFELPTVVKQGWVLTELGCYTFSKKYLTVKKV